MATQAFRLDMKSPLHVGEMGVGLEETLEYVPSDTLFSALVTTWLEMGRHDLVDALPAWSQSDPPLLLTSAFPCLGETLLYPCPLLLMQPKNGGKVYKKVRWVSRSLFDQLAAQPTQENLDHLWAQHSLYASGAVWADTGENLDADQTWGRTRVPKVTVDRVSNASALFHVGRVHFGEQAGLWFAADGDQKWLDALDEALELLADSGIGGQRSRGNGRFAPKKLATPLPTPATQSGTGYQVLLSRTAPTAAQMDALRRPSSSYQLVTVGGWASAPGDRPLIRQRVRMLAEGSIVAAGGIGQLVDVNPARHLVAHPIYRYGYGFGVPIHLPKEWTDAENGGTQ